MPWSEWSCVDVAIVGGGPAGLMAAEPEVGSVDAVPDGHLEVHHPATAERFENGVVELRAGSEVAALDGEVIEHGRQCATGV